MFELSDARGHSLGLPREPLRLVSLVPSDTYSLLELGARSRLIGRTAYCVEPALLVHDIEIVGGTKDADVERIIELRPELVIANLEENRKVDIERLEAAGVAVYVSFPCTVRAGLDHVATLAALMPSIETAAVLAHARDLFAAQPPLPIIPKQVFVPIWMDPLMTVNSGTFISDVVELAGGCNVFGARQRRYPLAADLGTREAIAEELLAGRDVRYPRVTLAEVLERQPEIALLPNEPHEFSARDAAVFQRLLPSLRVEMCDGRDLMWPGLRALRGLERIRRLIAYSDIA
ncbi:MAG: ABC transporter substrate-binding protein [Myxococcales bacterium]|nr:ABC transporter substrate-binding protein [Myxococcales bacterium]